MQKEIEKIKRQFNQYQLLLVGKRFLGWSKKKGKYIIKKYRKNWNGKPC